MVECGQGKAGFQNSGSWTKTFVAVRESLGIIMVRRAVFATQKRGQKGTLAHLSSLGILASLYS
jgi:hypothetical protein